MNRRGEESGGSYGIIKVVSIILIIIAVIVILNISGIIPTLSKMILGIGNEINLVNYTQKNNDAQIAFTSLLDNVKDCEKSANKECFCKGSLNGFYITHKLSFDNTNGSLFNIKGSTPVLMEEKRVKVNCIFKNNNFDIEERDKLEILFDDKPHISVKYWRDITFEHDYVLYKDKNGKICFLTSEVSKDTIKSVKEC